MGEAASTGNVSSWDSRHCCSSCHGTCVCVFVCLCVLLYLFSACFVVSFVLCFSLSQTQNPCAWGRFTLEWRMMEERLGMEHARPMAYVMLWVMWCIWSGVCENICAGLVFVHMCLYGGVMCGCVCRMFWGEVPPSCDVKKAVLETHGLDFRVTPQPAPYGVGAHFSPVADYAMECAPPRTGTQDTQETETGTGPIFATRDIVLAFVLCGTSVALGAQKDVDSKIKQPPRVLQPSSPGFGSSYDSVTVRCSFLYPRSQVHWYPLLVCLGFPSPAPPPPPFFLTGPRCSART